VCVGLIGAGYTGSYIFSQTVFTMRAGVHNRLCGFVVAIMELIVFALPFSVVEVSWYSLPQMPIPYAACADVLWPSWMLRVCFAILCA